MQCPFCDAEPTRVVDSRPSDGGRSVRRRRTCSECARRFTTYERTEMGLIVRKRDGSLVPFEAAKIRAGLEKAVVDRQVPSGSIDALVDAIEAEVSASGSEVSSDEIGRMVLIGLRDIDEVAYLRFASVYKDFAGAGDFRREMAALEGSA
ncbi:MAG: transcriptional regulator NrdR [Actinobacteria bacterium]|nr:transcriptional regulator NrdR [Actinomycetota bacterium]MBU1494356.1 transcriptional regulator NrdR [Actinomycetota bacterium]MBU1866384.1 transcriptional regulator NrdR [Actinomycetota bacterium]